MRKRDGGVGYDSTDLAAVRYRLLEDKKDWLVYVVDSGQGLHFEVRCAQDPVGANRCVCVLLCMQGIV